MNWTGASCCVQGTPTCGPGSSSSCFGNGQRWTGSLCCVD
jgi:hypothetical protein